MAAATSLSQTVADGSLVDVRVSNRDTDRVVGLMCLIRLLESNFGGFKLKKYNNTSTFGSSGPRQARGLFRVGTFDFVF